MTSIFFNPSARSALFQVQSLSREISTTTRNLSTGRKINTSADDPSGFAQVQKLQSGLAGFEVSKTNVQSGRETVKVGRTGADQLVSVLQSMKETITAANATGADLTALTAELDALRQQYQGIVDTAQFNGVSLLTGGSNFSVTSGVFVDANGAVQTTELVTSAQDLRIADTFGAGADVANAAATGGGAAVADSATVTIDFTSYSKATGDSFRVTIDGEVFEYVADAGDDEAAAIAGLRQVIEDGVSARGIGVTIAGTPGTDITITNASGAAMQIEYEDAQGGTVSGSLRGVRDLSVSTTANAAAALTEIDTLINAAIDGASRLGASEKRFDTQEAFLDTLILGNEEGISRIADIDVAEESIRLSNLQSQFDLALTALALSNESQNSVLRLFA